MLRLYKVLKTKMITNAKTCFFKILKIKNIFMTRFKKIKKEERKTFKCYYNDIIITIYKVF